MQNKIIKKLMPLHYSLVNYDRSNQDTCLMHKPTVFEGDWVQPGDLLADSAASTGGELSLGHNILVAYMPWEGYNFEDAILLNERLVYDDVFTSIHIERYETETRQTKFGDEKITRQIPDVSANQLKHLDNLGLAKIGSWVEEGDILVGKISPLADAEKNQSPSEKFLYKLLDKKFNTVRDTSLRSPKSIKAKIIHYEIFSLNAASSKETYFNKPRVSLKKTASKPATKLSFVDKNQQQAFNSTKSDIAKLKSNLKGLRHFENNQQGLRLKGLRQVLLTKNNAFLSHTTMANLASLDKSFFEPDFSKKRPDNSVTLKGLDGSVDAGVNDFNLQIKKLRSNFKATAFLNKQQKNSKQELKETDTVALDTVALDTVALDTVALDTVALDALNNVPLNLKTTYAKKTYLVGRKNKKINNNLFNSLVTTNRSFLSKAALHFYLNKNLRHKPNLLRYKKMFFFLEKKHAFSSKEKKHAFWKKNIRPKKESTEKKTVADKNKKNSTFFSAYHIPQKNKQQKKMFALLEKKKQLPSTLFEGTESVLGKKTFDEKKPSHVFLEKKPSHVFFPRKRNAEIPKMNKFNPSCVKIQVYLAEKRKIQVGDKMSGRHGNKGIVSKILPRQDMPYLPDGTAVDIVLNPLGVPSRMNVGQIYECLLGLAATFLGQNYKINAFDEIYGPEASRSFVYNKLAEAKKKTGLKWLFNPNSPGKMRLFDGRNGDCFEQPITVGKPYMLKLVHMVDDKIHARSTGPYSLVTQQPLRGRSKQGGQRLGEMEVWAIEGYGAAFTLLEMLTIKSDDMTGRMTLWHNLIFNKQIVIGTPESFKVLICELQALCLDIGLFK